MMDQPVECLARSGPADLLVPSCRDQGRLTQLGSIPGQRSMEWILSAVIVRITRI